MLESIKYFIPKPISKYSVSPSRDVISLQIEGLKLLCWIDWHLLYITSNCVCKFLFKGTVSLISRDPPCTDGSAWFTMVPLKP